ncbi:MAG: hypothetical protein ACLFWH_05535 [Actinomycetota bacterium]
MSARRSGPVSRALFNWGLFDLLRVHTDQSRHPLLVPGGSLSPGLGSAHRPHPGPPPVAERCVEVRIDHNPTAGEGKPGDHARVIAELRDIASRR